MGRLPDFIIIGAMKCATSSLHTQLGLQPGIFMTEPKEPYFFSNDEVYAKGIDWYMNLYDGAAPGDLCGESSTHYTKLPTYPHTVERIHEHVPGAKFIYVIRHPVDRLVSHYIHDWTENFIKSSIDEAVHDHPNLIDYGRYSMQLEPFFETFGPERVQLVFFESMTSRPQHELERVCEFIGYDRAPEWRGDKGQENVSAERLRKSKLRDAVVYAPIVTTIRKRIIPRGVRNAVKKLWTYGDRPELSETERARLEQVFNKDLARLGEWLGVELTCDNFTEQALAITPQWQNAPARSTS